MCQNLSIENLKDGRERKELLAKPVEGADDTSLAQLLQEERQEGDKENHEDGDDAALDPVVYGYQIVASGLVANELSI